VPESDFTTDPRIQEIDLGQWDQLTDAEARDLDPRAFDARGADKWHVRVPGGENYEQVAGRASDWAQSLTGDTFAVSHGALTRILRGLLGGMDWQGMSSLDEPQGVVFRIRGGEVTRLDP
jgi:broad specificity phosphatase PhoE